MHESKSLGFSEPTATRNWARHHLGRAAVFAVLAGLSSNYPWQYGRHALLANISAVPSENLIFKKQNGGVLCEVLPANRSSAARRAMPSGCSPSPTGHFNTARWNWTSYDSQTRLVKSCVPQCNMLRLLHITESSQIRLP